MDYQFQFLEQIIGIKIPRKINKFMINSKNNTIQQSNNFILSLILAIVCFESAFSQLKNNSEKPNIIFILTDDQRFDAIGYAGNKYVETPEMDKLATEGTYFKKAIVTTPICAASRASIITGLHERSHNFNFQTGNIRDEYMDNSYPVLLRNNGYYTGFFGKFGVFYDDLDKQFDVYDSYDRNLNYKDKKGYFYKTIDKDTVHLTRYTGQQALDFIENTATEKPFCLSLSFSAPHAHDPAPDQYFWQSETNKLLQNTTIPDPELGDDKYFLSQPKAVRDGFNRLRWNWRYETPEKYQHSLKGYYRMISGIDLEIKKIREKLKEKGLDKNTIIIVMGDNGYFLGERQLAGKWLMYDNSIRVPMIIFDPRENKPQDIDEMVLNIDIPTTIADFAGITAPKSWQGKSLKPIVTQQTKSIERDTILIEHLWDFSEIPPSEGVRTNKWKYFRYVNDKTLEELYDLEKDPQEINNLIGNKKFTNIANKLRKKLEELSKKNSDTYTSPPTNLTVELIRELSADVKILDLKPEFGWSVPKSLKYQMAYQILVASEKSILEKNNGDIWDSGRVLSNKSSDVEYDGKALESEKTYFWKVRIWDEANRLVNYSETQKFTTGKSVGSTISTENKFQIDNIKPVKFENRGDFYFIDFGKSAFATMNFTYKAKKANNLTIRIGEILDGENINRIPSKESSIHYQEIKVQVSPKKTNYQINIIPDERNTLPNKAIALPQGFPVLMPFRYAEIEGAKESIQASDFVQLAHHTYWDETASSFESDNDILNQVWNLCKYSIKATTFNGLYVGGDKERIPYEAVAYLNQLSHYSTDREYAMARRTIEYFMENPTWPTEWQLHVALLFYQDYMYTGNTELIEKYYDKLKHKLLFELSNTDGLISSENATPEFMYKLGFKEGYKKSMTDIIDWYSAGWGGDPNNKGEKDGYELKPNNTVVNAFFYKNMKIMAEFAKILGKSDEVLDFELRAAKVKKALNEQMFDVETGIYRDGIGTNHASLFANMMPLAFGLVSETHVKSVVEFIKSRGMACSVYGSQYLMDALYNAGEGATALKLLTNTSEKSWYNMIQMGSTITLNAWGAVPANVISRNLWGIQPKTAGFEIATISPQLGNLKSSKIEVPTVRGTIKGAYKFENDRLQTYEFDIPSNMVAEFSLKDTEGKDAILNGFKMPTMFDSIRLEPGNHVIQLKFNSF